MKKFWKAFTLTEVIITLGLFSFIMASFSFIVSTVVQNAYVNDSRTSLRQNLEFSSDVINRYLQNAQPQSITLFHGISNPSLKYCDIAKFEICFADRSLTATGDPLYYKIIIEKQTLFIAAQNRNVTLGRIYLYQYRTAVDLSLTPTQAKAQNKIVDSRVLTYRDTNVDLNNGGSASDNDSTLSSVSINVPAVSNSTNPIVLVTMYLEADSMYMIRQNTPAARNMQKLVSVQVQ